MAGKQKYANLGSKILYLDIFDQKCFIWVCFGENFKNTIVIFEIRILKFGYFQSSSKSSWFWYFWAGIWKQYCLIAKFVAKNKNPKFDTKNALFGFFFTKNAFFFPFLGGIMKNIWPYLKSAPSNLSNCKIWRKNKFRKFQKKMLYLGIFQRKCLICVYLWQNFQNTIVIFEISTVKFVCLQEFTKTQKYLNWRPKIPYLCIFGEEL